MSLHRIKELIEEDRVFRAYQQIEKAAPQSKEEAILLAELRVKVLSSIVSDLDEHGEANMDLYGDGDYSTADFHALLGKAHNQLLSAQGMTVHEPVLPSSPKAAEVGPLMWRQPVGMIRPLVLKDGRFLSIDGDNFCLRSLSDGGVVRRLNLAHEGFCGVALSPDQTLLAIGFYRGRTALFDLQSDQVVWDKQEQYDWVQGLLFSRDGRQLISSGTDCLLIQSVADGSVLAMAGEKQDGFDGMGGIFPLFAGADGKTIVFSANDPVSDTTSEHVEVRDAETLELISSAKNEYSSIHEVIGDSFVVIHDNIKLFDQYSGFLFEKLAHHPEDAPAEYDSRRVCYSPEHGVLAVLYKSSPKEPEYDWNDDLPEEEPTPEPQPDQVQIWGMNPWNLLATIELAPGFCGDALAGNWLGFADNSLLVVNEETLCFPLNVVKL